MESIEAIVIEPEERVEKKSAELVTMSSALAERARIWPTITCVEERSEAIEFIAGVKERLRGANEIKDFFVKPVVELVNRYRARFAPAIAEYEAAEKAVKARIAEYDLRLEQERRRAEREAFELARAEEKKREEEARRLEESGRQEAATALRAIPTVPVMPVPAIAHAKNGTSTRVKYVAVVVDEDRIPRRFLCADERALNQYAQKYKGQEPPAVEGVRWEAKSIVTVRR